jgi:hypothetical protein
LPTGSPEEATRGGGDLFQIQHLAGAGHGHGQVNGLLAAHALQVDGHQPGCGLVVGNLTPHKALNKEVNLCGGQFSAVAFFGDDVNGAHGFLFLFCRNQAYMIPFCGRFVQRQQTRGYIPELSVVLSLRGDLRQACPERSLP